MKYDDTIAAISTGMGNSGIGIVRIIGPKALEVSEIIYHGKKKVSSLPSHSINYGFIQDGTEVIDQVLLSVMHGPKTYTGEDTVEINCHGGSFVVKKVLETVLKTGIRLAEPGEISKRAFLNGKMDLSQAEAVADLISARNDYALKSSVSQLRGSLKERVTEMRQELLYQTAFIESALDDPEHISLENYAEELEVIVDKNVNNLHKLLQKAEEGRVLKEGIQTVIIGKPNVGKSSLLNVLAGKERAIVTDIAGTTRDILEENINLGGLYLNIIDTAGIRNTENVIEKMGVDKAKDFVENSDLVIFVVDGSKAWDVDDEEILSLIHEKKRLALINKSDLKTMVDRKKLEELFDPSAILEISAKEETGLEQLQEKIKEMFFQGKLSFNEEIYISNLRQKEALVEAKDYLLKVKESIHLGLPEDFFSIDLLAAYEVLGKITGETLGEDLIDQVFSRFCLGK